jgi:type IV secretion system protein VirB3
MPWEQPLNQILQSVEGPVAKIIAVIIIIVTGLSLAFRRYVRRFPQVDPDRIRPVHRVRRVEFLPVVFLVWRWGGDLMDSQIPGFEAPVHRALTEPILMGGAPRSIAILNGTLAAALGIGLRLWLAGLLLWFVGHMAAVWAAKRDPDFVEVVRRHLRIPGHLNP